MKIEYSESGFHPENIIPERHLELKRVIYNKYGTTNGIFNKVLLKGMEWIIGLQKGDYERVELVDPEARLLLTHTEKPHKTLIFRKNQRKDLTRISIHNIPKKLYDTTMAFAEEEYGTKYGVISYIMNQSIELMIEVVNGFVKLVETVKKPVKSFINDNKGQVTSLNANMVFEALDTLNLKIDSLKQHMERTFKDTVQSTLNIIPKVADKAKNTVMGTVRSHKREDKFKKAEKILDNLMKWNEYGFTIKDYHNSLGKLKKQGDPRTAHTDLEMLEADNRVKKVRDGAHGMATYEFVENNVYHKFNSDLAKTKFFDDFKIEFHDVDSLNLDELNELIFDKYELFDARSQKKRVEWLIVDGYVKRHPVNSRILLKE